MASNNNAMFDLGGFLEIQKNVLMGIESTNVPTDIDIDKVNRDLDRLHEVSDKASNDARALLTQQTTVKEILADEHSALETAKNNMLDEKTKYKRATALDDSKRKRMHEYNRMAMIVIITTVLILGIVNLLDMFPFFPEWIFIIIIIAITAIAMIQIGKIYLNVLRRSPTNFDQLLFSPPKVDSPSEIAEKRDEAAKRGNLLGSIAGKTCYGSLCCDTGTKWDIDTLKCIPDIIREQFSSTGPVNDDVLSNSPNEYDHYMKV